MRIHPQELLIKELVGSLTEEHQRMLEHMVSCPDCLPHLQVLLRPSRSSAVAQKLARVLNWYPKRSACTAILRQCTRLRDQRWFSLDKERAEAKGLYIELGTHPPERQRVILENNERFQTWCMLELLVQRSLEESGRNPAQGEQLATLAVYLAPRLNGALYGQELIEDLTARAWGVIGNARRIKFDLIEAETAFEQAFAHLERGTGDVLERAILFDFQASLRRAERRFDEAVKLLRRAVSIFREIGDSHRAGRSLINLSVAQEQQGAPEEAIPVLYEALELIDPAVEPQLLVYTWHNLMTILTEVGRCMEAQGLFVKARHLYRQFPDRLTKSREGWIKGKIARGLGQSEEAESCFLSARDGFLASDAAYDAALVSLELATLYAEQGRVAELKRVCEEMVPIFSSRQIHREALAGLAFLRQAVAAENASLEVVRQVAGFLKRAQSDPGLRFEQTS